MQFRGIEITLPEYRPASAWIEHGPFAIWLVRKLRPRRIVELGTHSGYSYFSFCQAVIESNLQTECYAVDTWSGDEHAGFYDNSVYASVLSHNERYAHFSRLLKMTFEAALSEIDDGSVDLLHIDGRHYYKDVKADFESWIPKLSPSAVVLLHDTAVKDRGFGVGEYWTSLRGLRPTLSFGHGHGLGVIFWGSQAAELFRDLIAAGSDATAESEIENYFAALGMLMNHLKAGDDQAVLIRQMEDGAHLTNEPTHREESTSDEIRTIPGTSNMRASEFRLIQEGITELQQEFEHFTHSADRKINNLCQDHERAHTALTVLQDAYGRLELNISQLIHHVLRAASRNSGISTKAAHLLAYLRTSRKCTFKDFLLIKTSPLFDDVYYTSEIKDDHSLDLDPAYQYLVTGGSQGRNPGPFFSEVDYKRMYPDVKASGMPSLLHFELYGRKEGRKAPIPIPGSAVRVATADGPAIAQESSAPHIQKPAEIPSLLDHPDWKPLRRLVKGYFDPRWYKDRYSDLRDLSDAEALKHFCRHGSAELRWPNSLFDPTFYLEYNPDIAGSNPLAHYLLHGRREGRQPKALSLADLKIFGELLPSVASDIRESRTEQLNAPVTRRICCLVHIYYPDLADELLTYICNIKQDCDIYINLVTTTWTPTVHAQIKARLPTAKVLISPDHGRDIGGLSRLLSVIDISCYDIFVFVHSKKSPHLPVQQGEAWRRELLEPILGSVDEVNLCISAMRSNRRIGLIGSAKWRCTNVHENAQKFSELLEMACVRSANRNCDFVSGTMFFLALPVVKRLQLVLRKIIFEDGHGAPLSFHVDGQYAHAVERLIGNLVIDEDLTTWYK